MTVTTVIPHRDLASRYKGKHSVTVFCMKIAIWASLLLIGGTLALSDSLMVTALGVLLLGAMFAHGVEIQHQVLHGQGLKNKVAHEAIGVLLGVPMLVSYASYQASHLKHHRYLGTPNNTEFFDYGDQYGGSFSASAGVWLNRLLMPAHYAEFAKGVLRSFFGKDDGINTPRTNKRIRRDYRIIFVMLAGSVGTSIFMNSAAILWLWIIPLFLVAAPIHALVELPEHYKCNTDSTDVFENTRTISASPLLIWFTNGNNFHTEHHMLPSIPIDRLEEVHYEIRDQAIFSHPSYKDFFKKLWKGQLSSNIPITKS
ncbi:fatty acid desaturase [Halomonas desiderata]|uniref:fatty acid desaturase family protein n=1 Tax=Billgrantia desiderata TaxID=52021 RepID=UPI00174C1AA4|nr:fatty acid desaturase [Halomonas desiderata]